MDVKSINTRSKNPKTVNNKTRVNMNKIYLLVANGVKYKVKVKKRALLSISWFLMPFMNEVIKRNEF